MIFNRMQRRKALIAVVTTVIAIGAQSGAFGAVLLDYWNFNNSTTGANGDLGALNSTGTVEVYDSATKRLNVATDGVYAATSYINLSNLVGTNGGTSAGNWGTFGGSLLNVTGTTASVGGALSLTGSSNNNHYFDIVTSTLGYQDLTVTYDSRNTSSGFKQQTWQYSIDGVNFIDTGISISSLSTTFATQTVDLSSISALANQTTVYLRVIVSGASTTSAANSGNNRFDNIQVNAMDLGAASLTWSPTSGSTAWNATDANWTMSGSAAVFAANSNVSFGGTGGTVVIDPAGVAPAYVKVTNGSGTYTFAGGSINDSVSGTATTLTKSGSGTLILASANNFSGGLKLQGGVVAAGDAANLGTGDLTFLGGTFKALGSMSLSVSQAMKVSNGGTVDTNGYDVTVTGYLSGNGLTKVGSGTLNFIAGEGNIYYQGAMNVNGGTVALSGVNATGFSAAGNATINVNAGGTLLVNNIKLGSAQSAASIPYIDLFNGGALSGAGTATVSGTTHVAVVSAGVGSAANVVTLKAEGVTDTLIIENSIQQYQSSNDYTKNCNAVINIEGSGRVILQSGGISSNHTYSGDWNVKSGVLQVGAGGTDTNLYPSGSAAGPYGQALNALGFKTTSSGTADPDLPDTITVSGGVLAIAVDQVNTNPNNTGTAANVTPEYIRNGIVLNGGAIAATGSEVLYDSNPDNAQSTPSGTNVTAKFGGDFTIGAGSSKVLLYNPVVQDGVAGFEASSRNVALVAGSRTLANASPGFAAGSVISNKVTWIGNLTVDPGQYTGGVFEINRTGGTTSVAKGASLTILANATVDVKGSVDVFSDGTNSVDVTNNGTLNVLEGSHQMNSIVGSGDVTVTGAETTLVVGTLVCDSLTLGGSTGAAASVASVPEPSTFVLALATIAASVAVRRKTRTPSA